MNPKIWGEFILILFRYHFSVVLSMLEYLGHPKSYSFINAGRITQLQQISKEKDDRFCILRARQLYMIKY